MKITPVARDILKALYDGNDEMSGRGIAKATRRPTGTVYPLLARMEEHGLVAKRVETRDEWLRAATPRPIRKYYLISPLGLAALFPEDSTIVIDAEGCECDDCLAGRHIPLDRATPDDILALLRGDAINNSDGNQFEITIATTFGKYGPLTWMFSPEQLGFTIDRQAASADARPLGASQRAISKTLAGPQDTYKETNMSVYDGTTAVELADELEKLSEAMVYTNPTDRIEQLDFACQLLARGCRNQPGVEAAADLFTKAHIRYRRANEAGGTGRIWTEVEKTAAGLATLLRPLGNYKVELCTATRDWEGAWDTCGGPLQPDGTCRNAEQHIEDAHPEDRLTPINASSEPADGLLRPA